MRAAIYARYSSDSQRDASIEDQLRLCQEHVDREGWQSAATFSDRAISGSSLLRPGMQGLLAAAMAGQLDVIVAEALDRLSRDQEDVAGFYKRMRFAGVTIVTLAEGEISDLHVGLKGTMNALFLKDLADKTRRGLRGRVEAGMSGGGNSYGYDVVRRQQPDGTSARGERRINDAKRCIIRRIFTDYASGKSPRRIAGELNDDRVPCPSGGAWGASTINGNRERGTGILNNELYIGRLIWNRLRYAKNPDTGKRVSRPNPPEQWVTQEVPALRIVDDTLWQSVKDRQNATAKATRPDGKRAAPWQARRPKTLFSGLIRCGMCGGAYAKISATLVGCAAARNKGTCNNRLNIRVDRLEDRILSGLSDRLLAPELFKVFADEFYAELNRLRSTAHADLAAAERELATIDRKLAKLVEAIMDGGPAKTLTSEIQRLEARQAELGAQLASADSVPAPLIHPALADVYQAKIRQLATSLAEPSLRDEASVIIRSLVETITLTPIDGQLEITLEGQLAGILSLCAGAKQRKAPPDLSVGASQVKMVAGAGFEPATFRL